MLSFRIQGGNSAANRFCEATRIFTLAESLGGVESLIEVPASMTHMGIPKEQREAAGVFDDLVRISCGVEVRFFFFFFSPSFFPFLFRRFSHCILTFFLSSSQDSEDLVADILQALEKVVSTTSTNGTSSSSTTTT